MNVMKRLCAALCGLALVVTVAAPAAAQHSGPQPGTPPRPGSQAPPMPMPGGGGMHGGMMGGGMMMCPMMSGMMGGGMMGAGEMTGGGCMMGMMGGQADPKTPARMLQMRGEIMKAVGDVLIKYGKALESQPAK